MNISEWLTKEEARARLTAIDADPDAIDWGNVRAALASVEAEVAAWPELLRGLPVEKTLAILRAHVAYLDAPDETTGRDVTYIAWTAPEPEAGLNGERAEVRLFGADTEDGEQVRRRLAETLGSIWGTSARHVHVDVAEDPEPEPASTPWATYPAEMERKAVLAAAVGGSGSEQAAPTPSAARAALLAAAHDALAALKSFEAVMAEHESTKVGEDLTRPLSFIRGTVRGAVGMIEGRLPPVERTPGVVLRAMLAAYEAAELDAAMRAAGGEMVACFRGRIQDIREALADHVVKGADPSIHCVMHVLVSRDYEARLRGDRPLDAPPMG